MPGAEIIKKAEQKMMNNSSCLNREASCSKLQENKGFLIEFNEDGTPIDCHKVNMA